MTEKNDLTKALITNTALSTAAIRALVKRGVISRDDLYEDLQRQLKGLEDEFLKEAIDNAMMAVRSMSGPS